MTTLRGDGCARIEQHHACAVAAIAVGPIHGAAAVGQHIYVDGLGNVTC